MKTEIQEGMDVTGTWVLCLDVVKNWEWKTYEGWGFNPMLCVLSDYTGKAGSQLLVKSDDWY